MNGIQTVRAELPEVKICNGQRVVTFKDIDTVHQRTDGTDGTAGRSFRANKKHFIEGVDYFRRNSSEAKNEYGIAAPNGLIVLTESGYLMIVKSFTDDLSWDVQRRLVNSYFQANQESQPQPKESSYPNWHELDEELPRVPLIKSWYKRNRGRIYRLCKNAKAETNVLYHYLLKRIGERYDLNAANEIYEQETGHAPEYAMDIVEYFPELGKEADKFLDKLERL